MSLGRPDRPIESRIVVIRGQRVLLAAELAALYGVQPKVLNQAVRRNMDRFPADFMFQLTWQEARSLRSRFVTLEGAGGGSLVGRHAKYRPYAFTEQGVAMLSSVLKSKQAVRTNVEIMRAFVRLRGMVAYSADLSRRLDKLEAKYDRQFKVVFDAIRELMTPPEPARKRQIGFVGDN